MRKEVIVMDEDIRNALMRLEQGQVFISKKIDQIMEEMDIDLDENK